MTSAVALAVSAAVNTVLAAQWADAVPGSGKALALAVPATALTTILGATAVVVAALHAPPEPTASIGRHGRCFP